ncbi:MAG: formate dehydrogenase accessory protein FdhE [Coriobacteriia bacterium]
MRTDEVIEAADAYLEAADEDSAARLRFFKGIWEIQAEAEAGAPGYEAPVAEAATESLVTGQPLFLLSEPKVPGEEYRAVVGKIAAHVADAAGLDPGQAIALREADLASALNDERIADAVKDPEAFASQVWEALGDSGTALSLPTVSFVLTSALSPFLTGPSAAALESLGEIRWSLWDSGSCPVCGSPAALGRMGESTALQGGQRGLWCSLCHAEWGFERLRCARCGSRATVRMRYTYEESDPAHRLHLCDECHGYLRVVFEDEMKRRTSMVVEDAVCVTLDAIARTNGYSPAGDEDRG